MPSPDRPTTRVNLSLPDELVAVLDRISKYTGTGRATILREVLVEGQAGLEAIAQAVELAANRKLDAFTVLADSLEKSVEQASQLEFDIRKQRRAMMRKPRRGVS